MKTNYFEGHHWYTVHYITTDGEQATWSGWASNQAAAEGMAQVQPGFARVERTERAPEVTDRKNEN